MDCRPLYYSKGSLLRRFASWRNPRRCSGPPPLRCRRRGAPAPSPPPRSRWSRPRHGGRGQGRAVSRPWGRGFFVGCRLGAFMRLRRLDAACVRAGCKIPLRTLRGILHPARTLRSPVGRPQPHFCPKAHALLARRGRGLFKLTGLARQPCNNLKLSPRPHRPKHTHRAFVIRQKLSKNEPVRRGRYYIGGHSLACPPYPLSLVFFMVGVGCADDPRHTQFLPSGFALGAKLF